MVAGLLSAEWALRIRAIAVPKRVAVEIAADDSGPACKPPRIPDDGFV